MTAETAGARAARLRVPSVDRAACAERVAGRLGDHEGILGVALEHLVPGANQTVPWGPGDAITTPWLAFLTAGAVAGVAVQRGGLASPRAHRLDVDLLTSVGMLGAVVGLPFEAATLAVLSSPVELLERYSMDRTRSSLRDPNDPAPDVATVRRDDGECEVPAEAVAVGDTVVVRPATGSRWTAS